VIETPSTTLTNLIQNGTFEAGTNKWRLIGNHHGEADDPDQPGNKVLRLVATGSTEHMSNHGETTFIEIAMCEWARDLISFRAKWVSGSRQFHTRLYFNRLPRTTLLDAPSPTARRAAKFHLREQHRPDLLRLPSRPGRARPFSPVTVSVQAGDPDGVTALTLWWRGRRLMDKRADDAERAAIFSTGQGFNAMIPGKVAKWHRGAILRGRHRWLGRAVHVPLRRNEFASALQSR
jgi:hypothetical protein